MESELRIERSSKDDKVIALAGNPNVGKSTVFNSLTGLKQHTGNWPGKTVTNAQGRYRHKDRNFIMVDLPGTYSLMANSAEEEVARDFICFGDPDATVVVTDATCLERNLNLVLQTLEITGKVVVCVNLLDEAKRKKIHIDLKELSKQLGVPVIGTSARSGKGLSEMMNAVYMVSHSDDKRQSLKIVYDEAIENVISIIEPALQARLRGQLDSRWVALKLLDTDTTLLEAMEKYLGFDILDDTLVVDKMKQARALLAQQGIDTDALRDRIVSSIVRSAEAICAKTVKFDNITYNQMDRRIDKVLTSKVFGLPIMLALLGVIFWLTITGANYPSAILADGLFWVEDQLAAFFMWLGTPSWVHGVLVLGIYRTIAWVVSVMLPPMAIFFPLFTLLEDLGYLPRVAFNLDKYFKRACACGKQALTMCMGFGCNAAGVVGCRIIESAREADRHHYQQFRTMQRAVPHAHRDHHDVLRRRGDRAVSVGDFRAGAGRCDTVWHRYDAVCFKNAVQNDAQRCAVVIRIGAAAIQKAANRQNHCALDNRQNTIRAGARRGGCGTGRARYLGACKHLCGRLEFAGTLREFL